MKKYVLFDARAHYDIDSATALTVSDSLEEAQDDRKTMFSDDCVIIEYDANPETNQLTNPRVCN